MDHRQMANMLGDRAFSTAVGGSMIPTPNVNSPLDAALNMAEDRLHQVRDRLDSLTSRLGPVLGTPASTNPANSPTPQHGSIVLSRLDGLVQGLQLMICEIDDLAQRLVV